MPAVAVGPVEGPTPWSRLALCDRCLTEWNVDELEDIEFTDATERWCPDCFGLPRRHGRW